MFVESIKAGGAYGDLKKTVTINILDFTYLNTARFHSSFHLYEDFDKTVMLTVVIEIHFIEYPKFRRSRKDFHNPLHRWLLFLDEKLPENQLEELMSMDPVIKKAEERLEWLSGDEDTLRLYEAREFSRYERNSIIADAKEEGRKEIARKLLALEVDLQKIAEATGLSEEEIKKL